FSIYPHSKMTAERMCALVREYGAAQLIVDSACDWGISDPLSVPKTAILLAEQGVEPADVRRVTYGNALAVYGQSGQMAEADWSARAIDQTTRFEGNTILRGGQTPRVEPIDS
ncbi:hydrolase TatD, partial [Microbacteriaceae bacterium K1510]|nr:hydrolase TatD [Microbacteriaceae bacterium K1510]